MASAQSASCASSALTASRWCAALRISSALSYLANVRRTSGASTSIGISMDNLGLAANSRNVRWNWQFRLPIRFVYPGPRRLASSYCACASWRIFDALRADTRCCPGCPIGFHKGAQLEDIVGVVIAPVHDDRSLVGGHANVALETFYDLVREADFVISNFGAGVP